MVTCAGAASAIAIRLATTAPRLTWDGAWSLDGVAGGASLIILATTALTVMLSPEWFRTDARHGEWYALLLLSAAGTITMASASDASELVLGVMLSSSTGYVLAAYHRRSALSVEAGAKYFLVGALTNAPPPGWHRVGVRRRRYHAVRPLGGAAGPCLHDHPLRRRRCSRTQPSPGIPPLAGFAGKLLLFSAAIDGGYAWLAAVAVANTVVSAFYDLRVIAPVVLDENRHPVPVLGAWAAAGTAAASVLVIALGVGAQALIQPASHAGLLP